MKHLFSGFLLCFALGFCASLYAQNKENVITVVYQVSLNDASSKGKIEKDLIQVEGIKKITADTAEKTVCIAYDGDKTSEEKITASFSNLGYEASVKTSCCAKPTQVCCDGTCPKPVSDASGKKHCNK